jgi:hypothetical protein
MLALLRSPATWILITINLTPIAGVVWWGWDAFVLLMLYWLETAIIAFWTVVRIAATPQVALSDLHLHGSRRPPSPLGVAAFILLHAGIFMTVHLFLLWGFFAGSWSRRVHGIRDFIDQIVIESGLWAPLLALFIGHGALTLFDLVRPKVCPRLVSAAETRGDGKEQGLSIVFGLYSRIVVMQVTIILGAWVALLSGVGGAFVFLIVLKTAVDVGFNALADHVREAWRKAKADSAASPGS